jgi:hypothetical protein
MMLRYVGPPAGRGVPPLPEGWPAQDHEEPDPDVAGRKLASGLYQPAGSTPPENETAEVLPVEEPPRPRRRKEE